MNSRRKDKPWHLKVTWTLSIMMLVLIFGFFYQSYQEMRKIAPVKVAIERVGQSTGQAETQDEEQRD